MKLPDWLEECLPAPRDIDYISYRDGKFYFLKGEYDTLSEAYDSVPSGSNMDFGQSVMDKMGWSNDNPFFTEEGSNRLFVACTDQERLWLVEQGFTESIKAIRDWRKNKDDFEASYFMLDGHPAFWTRYKAEPTYDWTNWGNVAEKFWFAPSNNGMMMECGGHIAPDYTDTYHDPWLDTHGKSFEDCIIQTAALVDKFFHDDGTPREGVEYEKSELELTLEARMEDLT